MALKPARDGNLVLIFRVMKIRARRLLLLATIMLTGCTSRPRPLEAIAAKHALPAGIIIESNDVMVVRIHSASLTPDIPRKRSSVIGHKTIHPIPEGELILL